jgi:hypothetical protein
MSSLTRAEREMLIMAAEVRAAKLEEDARRRATAEHQAILSLSPKELIEMTRRRW